MRTYGPFLRIGAVVGLLSLLLMEGCATTPRIPESILDTPQHHVSNGYTLLKKARYEDAEREFDKALRHDPSHSAAYTGMGLVYGYKGDQRAAYQFMEKAKFFAKSRDEELQFHVGWIRLRTVLRGENWLEDAERSYAQALALQKDSPEASYYMGLAYKAAYRFEQAKEAFRKVVEVHKPLLEEAETQLVVIERIEGSRPGSRFGKELVSLDRITRAETAGLLIHELGILEIYEQDKKWQSEVRTVQGKEGGAVSTAAPPDIVNHPLSKEIREVLPLNIAGLTSGRDGNFGPDEYVSRAGFAIMIASILSRIQRDPLLTAKHEGVDSPFKDVRNDAPYFGSIMVCRDWGGLDAANGVFNPMGLVSGYDALYAIRKMKNRLGLSN